MAYAQLGHGWWLFAGLFLLPDLAMLAYVAGPRAGAAAYNATHTLSVPFGLGAVGLAVGWSPLLALALIWAGHIGVDRALGYGLKYPTAFRDTHLQRVA
jgi:hypothetical protein